jgi:hypothetical protein
MPRVWRRMRRSFRCRRRALEAAPAADERIGCDGCISGRDQPHRRLCLWQSLAQVPVRIEDRDKRRGCQPNGKDG